MKITKFEDLYDEILKIEEFGDKWHYEGIPGPTGDTLRTGFSILSKLWNEYSILPQRLCQSVEQGLYIDFINAEGKEAILEIYNDMTGAMLIVSKGKTEEVIELVTIEVSDIAKLIDKFMRNPH